jgi:hypothetical protein
VTAAPKAAVERMRRALWTAARPLLTEPGDEPARYEDALAAGEVTPLWTLLAEAAVREAAIMDMESDDTGPLLTSEPLSFEEITRMAEKFLGGNHG